MSHRSSERSERDRRVSHSELVENCIQHDEANGTGSRRNDTQGGYRMRG